MRVEKILPSKRQPIAALVLGAATLLWACSTVTAPDVAQAQPAPAAPAAPAPAPAAAAPAAPAAAAEGGAIDMAHAKETFEALCSGCHESAMATDQRYSRRGWEQVIDRMYGFGLAASDEQAAEIVDYLTANYPAS